MTLTIAASVGNLRMRRELCGAQSLSLDHDKRPASPVSSLSSLSSLTNHTLGLNLDLC